MTDQRSAGESVSPFGINLGATRAGVRLTQLSAEAETDCDSDSLVIQTKTAV